MSVQTSLHLLTEMNEHSVRRNETIHDAIRLARFIQKAKKQLVQVQGGQIKYNIKTKQRKQKRLIQIQISTQFTVSAGESAKRHKRHTQVCLMQKLL